MVPKVTLARYLKSCDEILAAQNSNRAKDMIKEIINVLSSDIENIRGGLYCYSAIAPLEDYSHSDYIKDLELLRSKLQLEMDKYQVETGIDEKSSNAEHKIFISHSSVDKDYTSALVNLLKSIGLKNEQIICSSDPRTPVPYGQNIYDWLRQQFTNVKLHVLFVLSHNYYRSPNCLNEMGAVWLTKPKYDLILLPGIDFEDIRGAIDVNKIGLRFNVENGEFADNGLIKRYLEQLKDSLIKEFSLERIDPLDWEYNRNHFVDRILEITLNSDTDFTKNDDQEDPKYKPVVGKSEVDNVPVRPAFLLVYAAEGNGVILRIQSLSEPISITTNGKIFAKDSSEKEAAYWEEALDFLIENRWVKDSKGKGEVFLLTGSGYNLAERLKDGMDIDTSIEPIEEIKGFDVI